jgi:hypothetical protein
LLEKEKSRHKVSEEQKEEWRHFYNRPCNNETGSRDEKEWMNLCECRSDVDGHKCENVH